jgi:hypothetical protein
VPPKVKSWRDAGDKPYRKKFDFSTPPACTENLHFTLNGEMRRAPMPPPDASAQTAWEDANHKVS